MECIAWAECCEVVSGVGSGDLEDEGVRGVGEASVGSDEEEGVGAGVGGEEREEVIGGEEGVVEEPLDGVLVEGGVREDEDGVVDAEAVGCVGVEKCGEAFEEADGGGVDGDGVSGVSVVADAWPWLDDERQVVADDVGGGGIGDAVLVGDVVVMEAVEVVEGAFGDEETAATEAEGEEVSLEAGEGVVVVEVGEESEGVGVEEGVVIR